MDKKIGAIWLMSIAIYLIIRSIFTEWGISLLIFSIPILLVSNRSHLIVGLWITIIGVYLLIGFGFNLWHPGWVIFGITLATILLIEEKNLI